MGRHLWLIGMMGAGKTAVGTALAQRLGVRFIDTDGDVESSVGMSISRLWEAEGEVEFRAVEAEVVTSLSTAGGAVIATGGGVVTNGANVEAMRSSGKVVWLEAAPETLAARVGDGSGRPLLSDGASPDRLAAVLADRAEQYSAASDLMVATDAMAIAEIVERIEAWWNA